MKPRRICVLIVFCLSVFSVSCGPIPQLRRVEPRTNYEIGVARTTATGATMVEWIGNTRFLPGFRMIKPLKVDGIGNQPPFDAGPWVAHYTYRGTCEGGQYLLTNPRFYAEEIGVVIASDGSIPCEKPVVQFRSTKAGRTWATPEQVGVRAFAPTPYVAEKSGSPIRWELLYSGRSGSEVTLDYREYSYDPLNGTFARPAFYQQVKYDLATSKVLVFREMKLEILEASNSGVTFRVLKDATRAERQ
jgi:hypothetical protein